MIQFVSLEQATPDKRVTGERKKDFHEIYKEYIEVKLGGGHPNKILKQFLHNDRQVLNFDIVWFDEKYDKEEKFYKLHYFLSNSKVKFIIFF